MSNGLGHGDEGDLPMAGAIWISLGHVPGFSSDVMRSDL